MPKPISYHAFLQYLFFDQWAKIKSYAHDHGVEIIGDMPIYVSLESVDVWSHRELFELDGGEIPPGWRECRRIISARTARSGEIPCMHGGR